MARILLFLSLCVFVATGCTRAPSSSSKITINPPSSSMASAMASLPPGRNACYGVSVNVPGLTSPALTCSPEMGIIGGFVSAGSSISLDVPKGSGISIKLYLYLMNSGDTNPCPKMVNPFQQSDLANIYLVGSVDNLTLSQEEEVVNITSVFPGVSQNLAQQLSFPPSCTSVVSNNPSFRTNISSGEISNASHTIKGRVGRVNDGKILSNGSFKLIVNR